MKFIFGIFVVVVVVVVAVLTGRRYSTLDARRQNSAGADQLQPAINSSSSSGDGAPPAAEAKQDTAKGIYIYK